MLAEDAPKWGNDDPDVDAVVMELCDFIIKIHAELKGILGNPKMPALYPVSSNVPQGLSIGALPSGRRAGKPLADGCSPLAGLRPLRADRHPALAGQDAPCLPRRRHAPEPLAHPRRGAGRGRRAPPVSLPEGLPSTWTSSISSSMVGQDILRCAQERPEEYRSLLVRVAGYSAYFCRAQPRGAGTTSSAARSTPCNARDGPP